MGTAHEWDFTVPKVTPNCWPSYARTAFERASVFTRHVSQDDALENTARGA